MRSVADANPNRATDLSSVGPDQVDDLKQALADGNEAAIRSLAGEIGRAVSPSLGHREEELRWVGRARLTVLAVVPFLLLDKFDGKRVLGIAGIALVFAVVVWMNARVWKSHRAYVRACRQEGVPTELRRFLGRGPARRRD